MYVACVFSLSHPPVFSAHEFVKLPPFRNSCPGSHGTHSSLPHYRACLRRFSRDKNKRFRTRFPAMVSPCVELVRIHATYEYNTQHAGCEELSALSSYTDGFVSGFDLDPIEYKRYFFLYSTCCGAHVIHVMSYRYHAIYRMTSVSRCPEHILDVDIDISRKYRMIYRDF